MIRDLYINNGNIKTSVNHRGNDCLQLGYDVIYDKYLIKYKESNISLALIGILYGDDLYVYNNYFTNSKLYGYDIDTSLFLSHQSNELINNVCLLELDSTNNIMTNIIKTTFDIIIDDGDHNPISMIKTFINFYPKLNMNGIYFIEDVKNEKYKILKYFFENNNIEFKIEKKNDECSHSIIIVEKTQDKNNITNLKFVNIKEVKRDLKKQKRDLKKQKRILKNT